MQKYDGGPKPYDTEVGFHKNTAPKPNDDFNDEHKITIYHDYIIGKVFEYLRTKHPCFNFANIGFPQELSEEDIYLIIDNYGNQMKELFGFVWPTDNFKARKEFYEQIFIFDYIISHILQYSIDAVSQAYRGIKSQAYNNELLALFDCTLWNIIKLICGEIANEERDILKEIASVITEKQIIEILEAHYCINPVLGWQLDTYVQCKFLASGSKYRI